MNASKVEPYLRFGGNCEEAMKFYQSVMGGELEINHFSEYADPKSEEKAPKGVMHATLKNDQLSFMASDGMPGQEVVFGDSISMSIAGDDNEQLTKFFEGLSEGGQVTMPLAAQVWGDKFGMLTDKYGIHWMINIGSGEAKEAS